MLTTRAPGGALVPPAPRARSFAAALALSASASLALLLSASPARAALPTAGPATTAAPAAVVLPTTAPPNAAGPERVVLRLRPTTATATACSFAAPVCVHTSAAVPDWAARHVLRAAESALTAYRALGLAMPLPDASRGGSPAYDIYLGSFDPAPAPAPSTAPAPAPSPALPLADTSTEGSAVTLPDPDTEPRPFDQSAAYTFLPTPTTWGCDLSFQVARHAAEALLYRFDAAAERGILAASASYLASVVAPCLAVETPAIDAFQADPQRALTAPAAPSAIASGNLLFPLYLEQNAGSGDPGQLLLSLFAIASQKSAPAAFTWQNEPDTFDALRSSLRFRRGSLDDLLLDFAIDRAFVGDRSDGVHLAPVDLYGSAGRVFFEWSVPFASLPRRLAPARPLEPTGATYLWLDLATAPKDSEVTFVADWELPAVMRWSLVKIDKTGAESGRIDVAGIFGSAHVERTVVLREELAGLLLVGAFTGSLDRSQPFDPDDAPFMPHAYEVTLYK